MTVSVRLEKKMMIGWALVCLATGLVHAAPIPQGESGWAMTSLSVPSDGTDVIFRWWAQDIPEFEFGYFFVDEPDGSIYLRPKNRPHTYQLSEDGLPERIGPQDPGYLDYIFAERQTIVVRVSGSELNHSRHRGVFLFGDRLVGWYLLPKSNSAWWRYCAPSDRPQVFTSFDPSPALPAFTISQPIAAAPVYFHYRSPEATHQGSPLLSIEACAVPIVLEDTFTVFAAGEHFDGPPAGFSINVRDPEQAGQGLLANDRSLHHRALRITHLRVETPGLEDPLLEAGPWQALHASAGPSQLAHLSLQTEQTHGRVKIWEDGSIRFEPDVNDQYWAAQAQEPLPVCVQYLVSDGLAQSIGRVCIGHGYYRRGQAIDEQADGRRLYFLGGGGNGRAFFQGRQRFFTQAAEDRDIVLLSQAAENQDFANLVYEVFAQGKARSITSFNVTTREQASDPRIVRTLRGADVIWLGGGSQAFYFDTLKDTPLAAALNQAAEAGVSIGGTSSGTAIMGQAAYINLSWDSVGSSYVVRQPSCSRVRIVPHTATNLPLAALSSKPGAPLHGFLVDTHFAEFDRLPRLACFLGKHPDLRGLGVDSRTALFIEPGEQGWRWTVYGAGNVYVVEPKLRGQPPLRGRSARATSLANVGPEAQQVLDVLRLRPGSVTDQALLDGSTEYVSVFQFDGALFSPSVHSIYESR